MSKAKTNSTSKSKPDANEALIIECIHISQALASFNAVFSADPGTDDARVASIADRIMRRYREQLLAASAKRATTAAGLNAKARVALALLEDFSFIPESEEYYFFRNLATDTKAFSDEMIQRKSGKPNSRRKRSHLSTRSGQRTAVAGQTARSSP